jgi:hypothetical protein
MFTFCTNLKVYIALNTLVFYRQFLAKSQSQLQCNPSYVNNSSSSSKKNKNKKDNNNAYTVLVGKALQLGIARGKWEDNIKMGLKEIGWKGGMNYFGSGY